MRKRKTLQNVLLLTLFGTAIATACTVSSGDGTDDNDGGSGGFAGKGGTTAKGGTTGSAGETSKGGDTGSAGDTSSMGGTGAGGEPGVVATCDPVEAGGQGGGGMIVGTPYPDCNPVDDDDACGVCIQENCCEQQKNCNAFDASGPNNNVCGWGGPEDWVGNGGEFLCWQMCVNEKVEIGAGGAGAGGAGSDLPDFVSEAIVDECLFECATPSDYGEDCSGLPGDETLAITECVFTNCGDGVCLY
jgi:hypothetical protein